jgi:hypothetical protein
MRWRKIIVSGVELIAQERGRQIAVEGWTPEHDDTHEDGEMATAAATYAMAGRFQVCGWNPKRAPAICEWPWDAEYFKPAEGDPVRTLVKAGALIAAEIDRLQRKGNRG